MTALISTPSLFDFSRFGPDASNKRFDPGLTQGTLQQNLTSIPAIAGKSVTQASNQSQEVHKTFSEKVFDHAVLLKVLLAQYTMHLNNQFRERTFLEIDRLLNDQDWYEEDTFPNEPSFRSFVSWSIYTSEFDWTSLGISNDGNTLVAWKAGESLITANFTKEEFVRWTARISSKTGSSHIAGSSPIVSFASQFKFLYMEMSQFELDYVRND